jgi:NADPH:quinone reductase-like Zn-dependent oxidoreductase
MRLRYRILGGLAITVGLAVAVIAVVISYDADCEAAPYTSEVADTMKAVVHHCYGPPDVLVIEDVAKPALEEDSVLVRVRAASVNPYEWHTMRGSPYFMRLGTGIGRPKEARIGVDFAGTVEAVGPAVTRFSPGDEVFGGALGAFAEYVRVSEQGAIALKPANVSFEQAAGVGIAGVTALQAVRGRGEVRPGQSVLINGASGGVGTFAVQIAKAEGADVTGVCSTRNVEMVRSIGADRVIDYKNEDYTVGDRRYDVIIDMVGNHSPAANRGVLEPGGTLVIIGGSKGDWLAPLWGPIQAMLLSPFVDEDLGMMLAHMDGASIQALAGMMERGEVMPVVDRSYALADVAEAVRYSETGRARGKIILSID